MTENPQSDLTLNLCRAFSGLNDPESVRAFLEDIASPGEIRAMSQRLDMKSTGAGTATISRVKRCLDYGAGGYKRVIQNES